MLIQAEIPKQLLGTGSDSSGWILMNPWLLLYCHQEVHIYVKLMNGLVLNLVWTFMVPLGYGNFGDPLTFRFTRRSAFVPYFGLWPNTSLSCTSLFVLRKVQPCYNNAASLAVVFSGLFCQCVGWAWIQECKHFYICLFWPLKVFLGKSFICCWRGDSVMIRPAK